MYVQRKAFDVTLRSWLEAQDIIPLGPRYSLMSGTDCHLNLTLYRARKKFARPGSSDIARAQKSVEAMLAYDASGVVDFTPARMDMSCCVRKSLYNARLALHEKFSRFKFDTELLDFPSGESYDSSSGDVSLYAKLKNLVHWRVTPDCFDLFARVVYNTMSLKRIAKAHMGKCTNDIALYNFYKTRENFAFLIFREKLRTIVTFTYGSRLTTVPKDKDVDRVIEVECMGNMIVQRTIGNGIRKLIKSEYGIDLQHSQDLHKTLIANSSYATIDLKNASNSNWMSVIKFLVPPKLFKFLRLSRSSVVSYKGEYYGLNMLSPMGNGFTFEVMSLVLLALCRTLSPDSYVYGDDIIIPNEHAPSLIEVLTVCGYSTNNEKTFINSPFRESCGAFYHDDVGYITSYDMKYPTNDFDRMVLVNKIGHLGETLPNFKLLHNELLPLFDSLALRQDRSMSASSKTSRAFLTEGVWCSRSQWKKAVTSRPTSYKRKLARTRKSEGWMEIKQHLQYRSHELAVCVVPELLTKSYKSIPDHLTGKYKWMWYGFYLFAGKIYPKIRQTHVVLNTRVVVSSTLI
jgi:hypothetical protein